MSIPRSMLGLVWIGCAVCICLSDGPVVAQEPVAPVAPVAADAGSTRCVRAGAQAGGSGRTWKDAFPDLPKKLDRGCTYYVAAGEYGRHRFEDAEDGEKYIAIRKATESDHGSDDGWQKEYAQGPAKFKPIQFMKGHYVFDGQTGGGPMSWTSGHGFEIQIPERGQAIQILESGPRPAQASHIEIRHVNAFAPSIEVKGSAVYGCTGTYSNIAISHCYFHDMFGAPVHIINWNHFVFEYNCVARNKCTAEWHSEAVSSRNCSNVVYRYNRWENIQGTGIIMHMSGNATDWDVYGNVFCDTGLAPQGSTAHGVVADNQNDSIKRVRIYNNTIVGIRGISSGFRFFKGAGEIEACNNLWYQCPAAAHSGGITLNDYNTFADMNGPGGGNNRKVAGDPFVNSKERDFHLARPTDAGRKLEAPFDKDMFGNTRGADGVWDRGALEFAAPANKAK